MATEISPARLPVHCSALPPRDQWSIDEDDSFQQAVSDDLERRLAALNEDGAFMFESWPVPDSRVEAVLDLSLLLNAESASAELLHWVDLWRERVRAAVLASPSASDGEASESAESDEPETETHAPRRNSILEELENEIPPTFDPERVTIAGAELKEGEKPSGRNTAPINALCWRLTDMFPKPVLANRWDCVYHDRKDPLAQYVKLPTLEQEGWPFGPNAVVFVDAEDTESGDLEIEVSMKMRLKPNGDLRSAIMDRLQKGVADIDARLGETDLTLS